MDIDLKDCYAVVTGASSGLGYSMASALSRHGAAVAFTARPSDRLDEGVAELKDHGYKAFALPMDVRSEVSIDKAVKWVKDQWGRIDLLVNNAGLLVQRVNPDFRTNPKPFFEIDPDGFRDVVETNLTGYFLVARAFVPLMIARKKGRIVNISTSLSTMTRQYFTPYGPSRAGSEALSNVMTDDLKEFGITVNVLLPGGPVEKGHLSKEKGDMSGIARRLLPHDIMEEPILFLASPFAEGMTGERIIASEFQEWLKNKGIKI